MTQYKTCFKYFVLAYDNRIGEQIENKALVAVFADTEKEAIEKAKKLILRKYYEAYEVNEIIDEVSKK